MDRLADILTGERFVALLGYVVGAVIGVFAAKGQMGFSEWLWAGIAILAVIQLRLLAEKAPAEVAEEA